MNCRSRRERRSTHLEYREPSPDTSYLVLVRTDDDCAGAPEPLTAVGPCDRLSAPCVGRVGEMEWEDVDFLPHERENPPLPSPATYAMPAADDGSGGSAPALVWEDIALLLQGLPGPLVAEGGREHIMSDCESPRRVFVECRITRRKPGGATQRRARS